MNIGVIVCAVMAGFFLISAVVFGVLKERGAIFISGFNMLPEAEREKYDRARMAKDMRNAFWLWFAIFAVGGVVSYAVWPYFAIVCFAVWSFLFFRMVHFHPQKAFGKYRKRSSSCGSEDIEEE